MFYEFKNVIVLKNDLYFKYISSFKQFILKNYLLKYDQVIIF